MIRASFVPVLLLAACSAGAALTTSAARADGDPSAALAEEARAIYARGAASYDARRYDDAATEFARADALIPKQAVLELALAAVLHTESAPLGMDLVERAEGRGMTSTDLVVRAREKFADKAGRLVVGCGAAAGCRASVDGRTRPTETPVWERTGRHLVVFELGAQRQSVEVDVPPRGRVQATSTLVPPSAAVAATRVEPPPPSPQATRDSSGVSPTWFWIGCGVTAALGATAIVSGIDLQAKHSDFEQTPTSATQSAGRSAQVRTNVFIGATAIAAVATAGIGLFVVRWSAPARSTQTALELHLAGGPGTLSLGGSY